MSKGTMILHCGAREVDRAYLATIPTPPPSKRWVPIGHNQFVEAVEESLHASGFLIERTRFGLSREDARLFGVLDLKIDITRDVTLAVGIRSSLDQSFPLGFCAGNRVFVCDNLSFSSELMAKRKHTLRGLSRFQTDVADCVKQLPQFVLAEQARVTRFQQRSLTEIEAESLVLRAMIDQKIISHRLVHSVMEAWREPKHEAFDPRNAWSLLNAFTTALADRATSNPQAHAHATMKLQAFLTASIGYDIPSLMPPLVADAVTDCEAPSLLEE